jgi:hypothetical protein
LKRSSQPFQNPYSRATTSGEQNSVDECEI